LNSYPSYNTLEFERLYKRLVLQQGSAFFCVTISPALSHIELAQEMCERFPSDAVQIIDFKEIGVHHRFSSILLCSSLKKEAKFVFLANFHLACGDMSDAEFFQTLNLTRDVLVQLPVVFVFMMPLYFRIHIARYAPDFNSFFSYRADFAVEKSEITELKIDSMDSYSETDRELLKYYEEKYNSLTNHEDRLALETLIKILKLNASVRTLSSIELNRFYETFKNLLPVYQNEFSPAQSDIAKIYESQGDYAKALEWYGKALAIKEKVLGNEHPSTATTYNNIAFVCSCQGDYEKALEWYGKALMIFEKVLGNEHPDTATTYNNIALVYQDQGDYANALEWLEKDLAINEKVLGNEHPDTATTYNNIALVYQHQGEYAKALEWYEKALAIKEKMFGKEHPSTAITYNNIAIVYVHQGDCAKALGWYEKALAICEKVLGKKHHDTARIYNNIAGVYDHQGDYAKALEWYEKALAIFEKVLGNEHPSTANTYDNIAVVYENQGDYTKALELYKKNYWVYAKLIEAHPKLVTVKENMKRVYDLAGLSAKDFKDWLLDE